MEWQRKKTIMIVRSTTTTMQRIHLYFAGCFDLLDIDLFVILHENYCNQHWNRKFQEYIDALSIKTFSNAIALKIFIWSIAIISSSNGKQIIFTRFKSPTVWHCTKMIIICCDNCILNKNPWMQLVCDRKYRYKTTVQ